ncbi:MAG: cytochrome c oxidase subunit I [Anaerolineae bacterium]|nr:MAG: cytochrome c oxidase subunit I [Anaerolineae bacterium]
MTILSLGIVRGLAGQLIGTAVGIGVSVAVRAAMGLTLEVKEGAIVVGILIGAMGFMIGVGALTDWFKWMRGIETPLRHGPPEGRPSWTRYFGVDYSHKVIGIQYGVTSVALLFLAGMLALTFRMELTSPGLQFLDNHTYNTIMSTHGIAMIAAILVGVGAMSNYLTPLLIGASDMAFPRLNAFGFWINVPGAILVASSMYVGGWDTGWTAYAPLSINAPLGMQFVLLGVFLIGLSSVVGSINVVVTVLHFRAPGMSLFRMPIFVWSVMATSIIALTATQFIALSFLMVSAERALGMTFFSPELTPGAAAIGSPAGQVLLFQNLFWFYSHPAVYVFILPGLGIISELLPVFSRKPLFGYKWVALSSMAIALMGFLVWGHHMFTSGMLEGLRIPFMVTTMLIAVPTGVKFFSWVATLWGGKISFQTPMLFVLGAISIFLIGGLTGPPSGVSVTDLFLHDTYYIVGHFHATMFGGFIFPFIAAIYYWFPKITGRMYDEGLGKLHFWLMTPAFWLQSLAMARVGLLGMRRRIADWDPALGIEQGQLLITIAGFTIGFSMLVFLANLIISAVRGRVAIANPWQSRSPEFQIPSPIPEHSYAQPPVVTGEPYDYAEPESVYIRLGPASSAAD